jgi:hypothetical protein
MEVRIEAGYGMYLTYRYIDAGGEGLEPVGWQITEISLDGSQFFKHDSGHSAQDLVEAHKTEERKCYSKTDFMSTLD